MGCKLQGVRSKQVLFGDSMLESQFHHVLHTNYAPTEADAQRIREFCAAPEIEIKKLEIEISRLEASLDVVRRKRDELEDTVTAHRALLSPIRRLSPELLQNVFAFCLAEFPVMHVSEAPLLLGRVCKKWRDIVYSTAELWSGVHIAVPSIRHHERDRLLRLEALKEWLSRSGNHTLRISIYANHAAGDIAAFLDLIISLSQRWERIALVIPRTCFKQLEQSFDGAGALEHLRTFELGDRLPTDTASVRHFHHINNQQNDTEPADPFHLLNLCTKMERISVFLRTCSFRVLNLMPSAVAASLQELNIDDSFMFNLQLDELFSFITPCQKLRTLRIHASFYDSAAPGPFVTFPLLEHLMVHMRPAAHLPVNVHPEAFLARTFLSRLITPKLRHLELMHPFDVDPLISSLNNLFARSSCSLRTLSLRIADANLNLRHLLSSLEHVNDLQELAIDYRGTPMRLISVAEQDDTLLDLGGHDIYCPNLTRLALANCVQSPELTSTLTLIQSRIKAPLGCANLKVLDLERFISWHGHRPDSLFATTPVDAALHSFVKSAAALRDQGLEVLLPANPLPSPVLLSPRTGLPHPFISSFK